MEEGITLGAKAVCFGLTTREDGTEWGKLDFTLTCSDANELCDIWKKQRKELYGEEITECKEAYCCTDAGSGRFKICEDLQKKEEEKKDEKKDKDNNAATAASLSFVLYLIILANQLF